MSKVAKSYGASALAHAYGTTSPDMAIRAACRKLLRECGAARPPISFKQILRHLNVEIVLTDEAVAGDAALFSEDGRFVIHIERRALKERWQRARFTIAHECAHVLLYRELKDPELITSLDANPDAHAELERLCDAAASELLMPQHLIRAAARNWGVTPMGLKQLARTFAVSRSALIRRLGSVMPGTSVFTWKKFARTKFEEKKFRVFDGPLYHPASRSPWLPKGASGRHVSPRIIERVADGLQHEVEDNLEIRLGERRWKGRGIVTFFPKNVSEHQVSMHGEKLQSGLDTVYLFIADKHSTTHRQFLGNAHAA